MLLEIGSDREIKAVRVAGQGIAKAGDRSGSPRPAITKGQLVDLPTRRGWDDPFASLVLLSWTCILRIPSEALPLHRQRAGQDLESDERQQERAVVGLVNQKLIVKLNRRKHMAPVRAWSERACAKTTPPTLWSRTPRSFPAPCVSTLFRMEVK